MTAEDPIFISGARKKSLQDDHHDDQSKCGVQGRGTWASKSEYLLSCAGYAIGTGNIWRFPYLCYRSGGGAFLVPYLLMLFVCGIPLFFMETSIGQFGNASCLTMFRMSPLFKGAGFAVIIVNVIFTMYQNVVISYPLYFIAMSFRETLPWEDCDNPWNTPNCLKLGGEIFSRNNVSDNLVLLRSKKTPADEFFHNQVLRISTGIEDIGGIVWPLFICNLISWLVLYLCICNGIKTVGKVVYFTATFPFIILSVFFVRGITLPGAIDGILFYILPKWDELLNLKVWADAAIQMFFSTGPGWGAILNIASYNSFRSNNKLDSIFMPIVNSGTSILAGFVVFSVLGYMSHKTQLPVSSVATGGPGLAFVTYPEAITMLPWPQLWSILFFLMIYLLGVDSCFCQLEAIVSSITDEYPKLAKYKHQFMATLVLALFFGSIIFVTNGGMYILQLLDWYATAITVILVCFVEVVVVGWTYGCRNFVRDIEFMINQKLHWWWPLCWKYINPVIILFIFVTTIIYNTEVTYNGVAYPGWAIALGWSSCLISVLCIPGYVVYFLLVNEGKLEEKLKKGLTATDAWKPQVQIEQIAWSQMVNNRRFSGCTLVTQDM
ncbi:hypothetical protein QAD02_004069 [Eretmocerus hayati]|uniref:Uncharacterized protein n=1 Tax=Eretmocerus hayati TaxID=131215 RepID=A0ACC2NP00_9HYME|nr:hypothetical protein QAD02_004069 [Eretmocerus hayati]